MIEAIAGMPDGRIGFRVWGKVTAADYDDVLIPALREAMEERGEVRLVFQAGPGVRGLQPRDDGCRRHDRLGSASSTGRPGSAWPW